MKNVLTFLLFCSASLTVSAQPELTAQEPEQGFRSIFDGKTLDGWSYDPVYWSVRDGAIRGEVTPETLLERNTFIIWQGGQPSDFEFKLEYRVSALGNSGINYRSSLVEDTPYALKGYQLDIDGEMRWTGQNYEERARTFLALRGQATMIEPGQKPYLVASLGTPEELGALVCDGWNTVHLIARGNTLIHIVNGRVMSVVVDQDTEKRTESGLIGVQVHVGPPMTVEFRNIRIKE